jgi:alpha-galactosidase
MRTRIRHAPTHIAIARFSLIVLLTLAFTSCNRHADETAPQNKSTIQVTASRDNLLISTATASFQISAKGYIAAKLSTNGQAATLDDASSATTSDEFISNKQTIADFIFDTEHARITDASGRLGALGRKIELSGKSQSLPSLEKHLVIEVYDNFPNLLLSSTSYKNAGTTTIPVDEIVTQQHVLNASLSDSKAAPSAMWSFHGSSEAWGKDDVTFITDKFSRSNTMQVVQHNDENQPGGGIPVVAFWTGSVGEAIGHAEPVPLQLSLPVHTGSDGRVTAAVELNSPGDLQPGQVYATPLTFLTVFHGDFYEPLSLYSKLLQVQGLSLARPTEADYQANWCGWGYELNFTPKQMLGTIPKLKQLGIKWATLDAGWFRARGDWEPRPENFPDDSLQKVVKAYHDAGIHITLWWIPMVVEDGNGRDILNHRAYQVADVVKQHPDWLILDKDGKPARATAGLGALCPAIPEVQQYHKQLTERFIRDWDFDGHKLDFAYTVPPCYNPVHHHKSPQDSVRAVGDIYKILLETTRSLKPDSVTQACPCGTPPNLAWLPYIDQAVTADPVGSRQVRLRTKMYKALLGPQAAIYGDHVELTEVILSNTTDEIDKGQDFASEVGVGAVLGTKFTWPGYGPHFKTVELTPAKETRWKKWIDIYNEKMLSKGEFLDLYTYGYDVPEAYAIRKDGKTYYAFYAPEKNKKWSGKVELRGLQTGKYQVIDYERGTNLGEVDAQNPTLNVTFSEHLLLEASR